MVDWKFGWSTENEKTYITSLLKPRPDAMGLKGVPTPTHDPVALLGNYIHWAKHRIRHDTFGSVRGGEVLRYAESLLAGMS